MNLKYCLTGILCLFLKSDAQQIKPITIGDKVPDVAIKNIYNYPALQSMLSAFNNKLLILDFMATNCSSCIKALPAFDALQKKYVDKIQIVLVTNQSAERVKTFLHNHTECKLPMLSSDTVLSKLFPHTYISHEVWIKDGIVKAITYPEYVNAKNVEAVLAGSLISLPIKNDLDTCKKYSIIDLYLHTYGLSWYPAKRIILEVKDSSRFFYNKSYGYKEEWKQRNRFRLQSIFHDNSMPMRSVLNNFFKLNGRIEKRQQQCLVLRASNEAATNIVDPGTRSISKVALAYALGETYLPLIDESNHLITHTIVNENYLSDISLLKQTLKSSGLELVTETREMEVLVISEAGIINQKK